MNLIPDYYREFHCISDRCRHTCCAGWEIEIDRESLLRYEKDGLSYIEKDEEGARFIPDKEERCPYLNERNLCKLILWKGEEYLCQVCRDHPRFRNYWTGVTETGLGMVCEEACRIILSRKTPMKLIPEKEAEEMPFLPEDEEALFDYRSRLMDEASKEPDPVNARLREYFIFRHLPDALYDDRLEERLAFIDYCTEKVKERWRKAGNPTFEEKVEIARQFSYDIEYDEEAKEEILKRLEEKE